MFLKVPCSTILPEYLGIPFIAQSSTYHHWIIRNPALPSFYPFRSTYSDKMAFFERLTNLMAYVSRAIEYPWIPGQLPAKANTNMLHKYVGDSSCKTWDQLTRKAEMFIISRDEILEWLFPLMPNVVSLGCLPCQQPGPLSSDLESFMRGSSNGVVIMTFGTFIRLIPTEVLSRFLQAFKHIDHNVLWAYAGDNMPLEVPSKVKVLKWLPQNDVLGHPNTKLFITHCGNSGQYESLYHGIPMIGFPMFADQHHNALRMEDKGFGIKMDINKFTSKELARVVEKVIGSEKSRSAYTRNAKAASAKLKSRPLDAQQKAAYWVEYILKYSGKDLRSSAMDMSLAEFLMVDILVFILMVLICSSLVLYVCCRWCLMFTVQCVSPTKHKLD